jgi:tetratricopeptide (TPR) repeat protein
MQAGNERPYLSEQAVKEALERLTFNSRLRDEPSPLEKLLLVLERVRDPSFARIVNAPQVALDELLLEWIRTTFDDLRYTLHFPPLDSQITMAEVARDIQQIALSRVPDLWAWSILYYRYAFEPVPMEAEEIASHLVVSIKTLRRYERWGIRRLTRKLCTAETMLRRAQLERAMLAQLPAEPGWRIVGREQWLQKALELLREVPQRFLISGDAGVGKATAARALIMRMIQADLIDQVLWLEAPTDADNVRAALREMAWLPPDPHIRLDLREYLSGRRTLIALCRADALLLQEEEAERLLRDLDMATVVVTVRNYVALRALTAHLPLLPLDEGAAHVLGERLWSQFQSHVPRLHGELEYLLEMAKGNPEMLRWLISTHRPDATETREANVVGRSASPVLGMLSGAARTMLYALVLLPEEGKSREVLASVWEPAMVVEGLAELAQAALLLPADQSGIVRLSNRARALGLESLEWDDVSLESCLHGLDQALLRGSSEGLALVEALLMDTRGLVNEMRRQSWLAEGWRWAVEMGRRTVWLALLRAATEPQGENDARLWIGRAVCARGLALWQECALALQHVIKQTGDIVQPDFIMQTEALLERAVLYRLLGEYQRALDDLERVQQRARQFHLQLLSERAALERAQLAIDLKHGEDALYALASGGVSMRQQLLTAEAYLLLQREEDCLQLLEQSRSRWEAEDMASAIACGLVGRALHRLGRLEEARRYFDVALTLHDRAGDMYSFARMSNNMGVLLNELGAPPLDAMAMFQRAEREQRRLGDRVGLATTQANVRRLRGNFFDGKY